jgi:hypothetical protein
MCSSNYHLFKGKIIVWGKEILILSDIQGTTLTRPCSRFPATVGPGVSSIPCISGPKGTTSPVTSGPNSHVDLFQVYPL